MEQLKKEFLEQIRLLNDEEITEEKFFLWFIDKIVMFGGKLPPAIDDTEIPPQP